MRDIAAMHAHDAAVRAAHIRSSEAARAVRAPSAVDVAQARSFAEKFAAKRELMCNAEDREINAADEHAEEGEDTRVGEAPISLRRVSRMRGRDQGGDGTRDDADAALAETLSAALPVQAPVAIAAAAQAQSKRAPDVNWRQAMDEVRDDVLRTVSKMTSMLQVSTETSASRWHVRLGLKSSRLKGTDIYVDRDGHRLTLRFVTSSPESYSAIKEHIDVLKAKLERSTDCFVEAEITIGVTGEDDLVDLMDEEFR